MRPAWTNADHAARYRKYPRQEPNNLRIRRQKQGFAPNASRQTARLSGKTAKIKDTESDRIGQADGAREPSTADQDGDQNDRLDRLAAALLTLSPADQERLAAMLTGQQGEGPRGTA